MNNAITLVGYVGQNPQTLSFGDTGNKLVKFSVAVREYSANTEEKKTLWVDVDAWNGLGDRVLKTVTKGREVVINGRLAITNYVKEEDGIRREVSKPVIKLTSFHLCGKRPLIDSEPQAEDSNEDDQEGLA